MNIVCLYYIDKYAYFIEMIEKKSISFNNNITTSSIDLEIKKVFNSNKNIEISISKLKKIAPNFIKKMSSMALELIS